MKSYIIQKYNGEAMSVFSPAIGCIPFDPANTDYQRFKQDIADGAELQDADGVVMTPEQVAAFVADLP
jgi:hypothetical protein